MALMYGTCLFCQRPLGANEAIERFPVGRRLAFDAARGRLWVVCRRCERWNLSPLESRWEAIEECERRFRGTRLRASTDEIGLARLSDGTELVRIGDPIRPEFAAWRYGDQFGRRRRRAIAYGAAGALAGGAVIVGGMAAGVSIGGGWYGMTRLVQWLSGERTAARLHHPDGPRIRVQHKHLTGARLRPADHPLGWELSLRYVPGWAAGFTRGDDRRLVLRGEEAVEAAGRLLARVNRRGGSRRVVGDAVTRIEEAGHPERFLREASRLSERARREPERGSRALRRGETGAGSFVRLPKDVRLAMEMATQEEAERQAMEGRLAALEAAWREAEEVAAIADDLLVPRSVRDFLSREKDRLQDRTREGGFPPRSPKG